jgi:glycosyltransferase involved in cell wall biosynthesis
MPDALRALFVNEGALGAGVLGHVRVAQTLAAKLRSTELEPRFALLPPMSRATHVAVRQVPWLGRADLDLQPVRWHLAQGLRARRVVRAELKRHPFDVLHLHAHTLSFLLPDVMRRVPALLSLDATVWDWHQMGIWRRPGRHSRATLAPSLALERHGFTAAARVLAFTRWGREAVERECPGARVIEHHPGIDLQTFRPGPRPDNGRPRVLFVGGRFAEKGGHLLLSALGPHAGRELELDIVTPAQVPPRPGVRVHRLTAHDHELVELYRRADVFCLPTLGDAVPLSVVEAMACGAAVVASDVGAISDLLDGGRVGRLIPPGNLRALRGAVLALARDREARIALTGAARARCEAHYDAAVQARRLVAIMHEVVGR